MPYEIYIYHTQILGGGKYPRYCQDPGKKFNVLEKSDFELAEVALGRVCDTVYVINLFFFYQKDTPTCIVGHRCPEILRK